MGIGQHPGDFLAGALAAFAAGILAGRAMMAPIWPLAACFVLFLMGSFLLAWRQHPKTWMAVLGLCFVTGALRFGMAYALPDNDISRFAGNAATVEGMITEEPRVTECADGTVKLRYAVDVHAVKDGKGKRAAAGGLYVYGRVKERALVPEARIGDGIRASGTIRLPHGYGNPGQIDTVMLLRCQGITAQMAGGKQGVCVEPQENKLFLRKMEGIRKSYRENMQAVMPKADAAAIFAMLFGGYEGLKEELVEAFTATGIVHILSVSGSHVSLIAATMAWLGALLRLSRPAQCLLVLGVIAMYCILSGCVPPVIRSGIMGGLAFLALAMERENDARRILLLTGLGMLLYSPLLLFHISFQLSFAATAGLIYVAPALRRWMEGRQLPEFAAGSLAITIAAQAFTMPLIAWYFNQLSLSSLLANLLVVPIVEGMIVLGLFAGLLAMLLPLLGKILFLFDSLLLGLVYEMTRWMARLPGSQVYFPTMHAGVCGIFYAFLLYAIQDEGRKDRIRAWMVSYRKEVLCTFLAGAIFFMGWRISRPPEIMVAFLDVGQGDAMVVKTVHGHAVMFDTGGTRDGGFDIGSRVDVPYLLHYGVTRLDYIFLTHAHEDHAAGAGGILKHMPVSAVITASEGREEYKKSLRISPAEMKTTIFAEAQEGEIFEVDGVRIEVLYAPSSSVKGQESGNEASNVYRIVYGNASFLITGDLTKENEKRLLEKGGNIRCTVLKVGHHGSNTSSSEDFLQSAAPRYAVICVGAGNSFGHPRAEVLERLQSLGAKILRTDQKGEIKFCTDGKTMHVTTYTE